MASTHLNNLPVSDIEFVVKGNKTTGGLTGIIENPVYHFDSGNELDNIIQEIKKSTDYTYEDTTSGTNIYYQLFKLGKVTDTSGTVTTAPSSGSSATGSPSGSGPPSSGSGNNQSIKENIEVQSEIIFKYLEEIYKKIDANKYEEPNPKYEDFLKNLQKIDKDGSGGSGGDTIKKFDDVFDTSGKPGIAKFMDHIIFKETSSNNFKFTPSDNPLEDIKTKLEQKNIAKLLNYEGPGELTMTMTKNQKKFVYGETATASGINDFITDKKIKTQKFLKLISKIEYSDGSNNLEISENENFDIGTYLNPVENFYRSLFDASITDTYDSSEYDKNLTELKKKLQELQTNNFKNLYDFYLKMYINFVYEDDIKKQDKSSVLLPAYASREIEEFLLLQDNKGLTTGGDPIELNNEKLYEKFKNLTDQSIDKNVKINTIKDIDNIREDITNIFFLIYVIVSGNFELLDTTVDVDAKKALLKGFISDVVNEQFDNNDFDPPFPDFGTEFDNYFKIEKDNRTTLQILEEGFLELKTKLESLKTEDVFTGGNIKDRFKDINSLEDNLQLQKRVDILNKHKDKLNEIAKNLDKFKNATLLNNNSGPQQFRKDCFERVDNILKIVPLISNLQLYSFYLSIGGRYHEYEEIIKSLDLPYGNESGNIKKMLEEVKFLTPKVYQSGGKAPEQTKKTKQPKKKTKKKRK